MQFRVIGCESETGDAVDVIVEEPTPSSAEERANRLGILVERIEVVESPSVLPPIDAQAETRQLWNPGIAALLSFIIPGAGQMYKSQVIGGLAWFIAVAVGYFFLVIPGLALHLFCIISASMGDPTQRKGR